jgi:hypothetical protein
MRTNIEIDDKLMKQAMNLSTNKTKKAVVEEALRMYVRTSEQHRAINSLWGILKDEGWDGAPEGKDKWAEAKERHAKEAKAGRKKAA